MPPRAERLTKPYRLSNTLNFPIAAGPSGLRFLADGAIYHADHAARRGDLKKIAAPLQVAAIPLAEQAAQDAAATTRTLAEGITYGWLTTIGPFRLICRRRTKAFHEGGLTMNREMMAHHIAILEDIERKQADCKNR